MFRVDNPDWVRDEAKWKKAQSIAKREYPKVRATDSRYWKIVTGIYKRMGGVVRARNPSGESEFSPSDLMDRIFRRFGGRIEKSIEESIQSYGFKKEPDGLRDKVKSALRRLLEPQIKVYQDNVDLLDLLVSISKVNLDSLRSINQGTKKEKTFANTLRRSWLEQVIEYARSIQLGVASIEVSGNLSTVFSFLSLAMEDMEENAQSRQALYWIQDILPLLESAKPNLISSVNQWTVMRDYINLRTS